MQQGTSQKLKIAMIAPIAEKVPPRKYGGTERVINTLTEELVKRGHDVTLFATGDSQTSARLSSVHPKPLREDKAQDPYGLNERSLLHITEAYKRQHEFDIIHDHNSILSVPTAQFIKTPTVITLHGEINPDNLRLYESANVPYYVTISKSQLPKRNDVNVARTVYNGLNMENYPFVNAHKRYLSYIGRISEAKGTHIAIKVAKATNIPLIIAAKLDDAEKEYYNKSIKPNVDGKLINWVGEVDEFERNKLLSEAICLLNPITWAEPFGLTMIEAMACGSPVIAFDKGSAKELVWDGNTGFIVQNTQEMIEGVSKLSMINRNNCRNHALLNFSGKKMADRYEELYYTILVENISGIKNKEISGTKAIYKLRDLDKN
jgi:glycosyltransferase involved in cell wall biosynthesis